MRYVSVTTVALLATLVLIFAFQADNLTSRFFHVVLIAIPILVSVIGGSSNNASAWFDYGLVARAWRGGDSALKTSAIPVVLRPGTCLAVRPDAARRRVLQ